MGMARACCTYSSRLCMQPFRRSGADPRHVESRNYEMQSARAPAARTLPGSAAGSYARPRARPVRPRPCRTRPWPPRSAAAPRANCPATASRSCLGVWACALRSAQPLLVMTLHALAAEKDCSHKHAGQGPEPLRAKSLSTTSTLKTHSFGPSCMHWHEGACAWLRSSSCLTTTAQSYAAAPSSIFFSSYC